MNLETQMNPPTEMNPQRERSTSLSGSSPSPDGILDEQQILERVRSMLVEVIGEDYLTTLEIVPETSFQDDLEIESIELVALGERLQEEYVFVDFAEWLATMEVDEILAMTVGDLVTHIAATHASSVPVPTDPEAPVAAGEHHG
jgi:acyl carrier protein